MNALLDLRLFGQDFDQDTAFELRICHWGILGAALCKQVCRGYAGVLVFSFHLQRVVHES